MNYKKAGQYTLQTFIGLVLLTTAIGKLLDVPGFAQVIGTYQVFPYWLLLPVAILMIITEFVIGVWVISGKYLNYAALSSAGLHGVFTIWATITLLRGIEVANCGCFGVFWARPLDYITLIEDLVMVGVSLGLYFTTTSNQQ